MSKTMVARVRVRDPCENFARLVEEAADEIGITEDLRVGITEDLRVVAVVGLPDGRVVAWKAKCMLES